MVDTEIETARGELERSLGLKEAMTIGVGTMIGAGIFIFPGLASGEAGMAAMVSFAIGGLISVLVAMCTAELATGIPRSGGTYYFVAEGVGELPGALVGIGLWWGLVFASAFYLFGFGLYVNQILDNLDVALQINPKALGIAAAVLLVCINVLGTEKAGELQDGIVALLLSLLAALLSYGLLDATGILGRPTAPSEFAPHGPMPIFEVSALVFTSYLGFAQIANVAGEIKEPHKNLPRAMIGSVLLVGILYVLTILVATSAVGSEELGRLGETAMVQVGRVLFGSIGAVLVLTGGLLATISSANASIMSSSRSVYALSSDRLLPEKASQVNERLGTPIFSILMAGGPVVLLIALGRVETLAEVASFLHLILYGLMCVAVFLLRREDPDWYKPTFRAPGFPLVPLLGAAASFGLLLFMEPLSQILGVAMLVGAMGWYFLYRKWIRR